MPAGGTLRRTHFFDVRDGDLLRGLNNAVARKWVTVHHRDRSATSSPRKAMRLAAAPKSWSINSF